MKSRPLEIRAGSGDQQSAIELRSHAPARRIHSRKRNNCIWKRVEEPPSSARGTPFGTAWPRRDSRWRLPLQQLTTVAGSNRPARSETPNATESVRSNPNLSPKQRRRAPKTTKPCTGNKLYLYRRKSHLRGRYNRPWRFHRSISRAVTGRRNRDLA